MSLKPRSRTGRAAFELVSWMPVLAAIGFLVALGFAIGPWYPGTAAVLGVIAMAWAYRCGKQLRRLRAIDPHAGQNAIDSYSTRLGKWAAGMAFVVMGICVVLILVVFATHI